VTIHAQGVLRGADGIGALVHVVERTTSLRSTPADLWAATPIDRMDALLRASGVPIGLVTDGQWWGLVCAREGKMTASGIVDALTWISEPRTRDAFFTVMDRQYIIGGDPDERLPELFKASEAEAEEITEALGAQVRSAVELLIQAFAEAAVEAHRRGHVDPLPQDAHATYEAAVTVMMRVVFLLFAEERGLLPSGDLFDQGYGIAQELARLETREAAESEESLDSTTLTWHRLLATSQALYAGASFENLRMPAYGGSLFDPARFLFLTATTEQGSLAVAVSTASCSTSYARFNSPKLAASPGASPSATSMWNRSATSTKAYSATPAAPSMRSTSAFREQRVWNPRSPSPDLRYCAPRTRPPPRSPTLCVLGLPPTSRPPNPNPPPLSPALLTPCPTRQSSAPSPKPSVATSTCAPRSNPGSV
jgi:hypothetical protein